MLKTYSLTKNTTRLSTLVVVIYAYYDCYYYYAPLYRPKLSTTRIARPSTTTATTAMLAITAITTAAITTTTTTIATTTTTATIATTTTIATIIVTSLILYRQQSYAKTKSLYYFSLVRQTYYRINRANQNIEKGL